MIGARERALEQSVDGWIDPRLREAVRRLDREQPLAAAEAKALATPVVLPRARTPGEIVYAMARIIIDTVAIAGSCSFEDLARHGFDRAEVATHGEVARAWAQAAMECRAELPVTTFTPRRPAGAPGALARCRVPAGRRRVPA